MQHSMPIKELQRRRLLAALIAAGLLPHYRVDAAMSEQKRDLSAFERVSIDLPAEVRLVIAPQHSIRIQAEPKVLAKIRAKASNGVLTLGAAGSFQTDKPIFVEVFLPVLREIRSLGASTLVLDSFVGEQLQIHGAGSSNLTLRKLNLQRLLTDLLDSSSIVLSGEALAQQVTVSDAGSYDAQELKGDSASVRVKDSGDAVLNVAKRLDVTIAGAGSVEYLGNPSVSKQIFDAGSLDRR